MLLLLLHVRNTSFDTIAIFSEIKSCNWTVLTALASCKPVAQGPVHAATLRCVSTFGDRMATGSSVHSWSTLGVGHRQA